MATATYEFWAVTRLNDAGQLQYLVDETLVTWTYNAADAAEYETREDAEYDAGPISGRVMKMLVAGGNVLPKEKARAS